MNNSAVSPITTPAKRGRAWPWIAGSIGVIVVVALALLGAMNGVPSNLDFSTTRASAHHLFKATIHPAVDPIPINTLHQWTLHVATLDGKPVENATITLQGDMPQHGHGLPTKPEVSAAPGAGDYLVDGLKFQMGGWWVVDFDVHAAGKTDRVSFNLMLK